MYAYSSTKNFYIFDKLTGNLESLLIIPFEKEEVNGMVVSAADEKNFETLAIYSDT